MVVINLASLNVRGLNNYTNRNRMFDNFYSKLLDIVFMQETYCSDIEIHKKWEKHWGGGSIFSSFGTAHYAGVSILISKFFLNYCASLVYSDSDGRIIIVDLTIENKTFRLINIYAPTVPGDRVAWLNTLTPWLQNTSNKQIIWGGDFNYVENTRLDKIGGIASNGTIGSEYTARAQINFQLFDAYRFKHPYTVATTWRSSDVATRLDRFYLSNDLQLNVKNVCITPMLDTDHSMVRVTLDMAPEPCQRGPGYWKCNVSVLSDYDFKEDLTLLCIELMQAPFKNTTWWEHCKSRFKQLLICHSCRLADNRRREIQNVENMLNFEYNNINNINIISDLKTKLQTLQDEKIEGAKIRSRAQHLQQDEKPTQFFLRTEKQNGKKSSLTMLTVDGVISKDRNIIMNECFTYYKELYSHEPIDINKCNDLLQYITKLNDDCINVCEGSVCEEECFTAIKTM